MKLLSNRSWNGDYLNNTSDNVDVHFYRDSLKKEGASKVAFSCKTIKFNRHGKVTLFEIETSLRHYDLNVIYDSQLFKIVNLF